MKCPSSTFIRLGSIALALGLVACAKQDTAEVVSLEKELAQQSVRLRKTRRQAVDLRHQLDAQRSALDGLQNTFAVIRTETSDAVASINQLSAEANQLRDAYQAEMRLRAEGMNFTTLVIDGRTFAAVTLKEVTEDGIAFTHSQGVGLVSFDHLPGNLIEIFGAPEEWAMDLSSPDGWEMPIVGADRPANWNTDYRKLREQERRAALRRKKAPPSVSPLSRTCPNTFSSGGSRRSATSLRYRPTMVSPMRPSLRRSKDLAVEVVAYWGQDELLEPVDRKTY
jgi:hypothetical protein